MKNPILHDKKKIEKEEKKIMKRYVFSDNVPVKKKLIFYSKTFIHSYTDGRVPIETETDIFIHIHTPYGTAPGPTWCSVSCPNHFKRPRGAGD